jgi:hypothetical protein
MTRGRKVLIATGIALLAVLAGLAAPAVRAALAERRAGWNQHHAKMALMDIYAAEVRYHVGDEGVREELARRHMLSPSARPSSSPAGIRASPHGRYAPSLAELGAAGLLDPALATGTKEGYRFEVVTATSYVFEVVTRPIEHRETGFHFYQTDESGIVRFSTTGIGASHWSGVVSSLTATIP